MAMIAYGAARFALATGKEETAKELLPLINWCLAYLEKQETDAGVIRSDADELEGRFPAGTINLSTNSLAYGAYIGASHLAVSLNQPEIASSYNHKAKLLRAAIDRYFGADVQGFKTYRYYDGNLKLRSWICLPLVMGITERKKETIDALFPNTCGLRTVL
jgi:GH15 family glucan-1,4-alpha-glucosidase